ncbi:MAG: hypothetical protein HYW81_03535 [Parcubacteria group bacterium]|nr:hypothetical protein [Parcubacteria group bacterium]
MLANARYYLARQRKNPRFIQELARYWERELVPVFLSELKRAEKGDLKEFSDRELIAAFKRFSKAYDRVWQESIFLDSFDYSSDILVPELLSEFRISLAPDELTLLLSPEKLSWIQREKKSLLSLAQSAGRNRALLRAMKGKKPITAIKQKHSAWFRGLTAHAKAFHWIYNDYAIVRNLGPAHFLKEIRALLADKKLEAVERANIAHIAKNAAHKRRLERSLRMPKRLRNLFSFFVVLGAFRDSRKAYNQMAHTALLVFSKEMGNRCGVPLRLVHEALWWEIQSIESLKKLEPELKKRSKGNVSHNDYGRHIAVYTGPGAKALFRSLESSFEHGESLSGRSAFPGVVRGTARLVRSQKEFKKMRKGDILVAPNTRPEYVPIMKKAGAIVTEEGGITSHASIVSRELRIPCVVGVQGALSVLKDGDRVEVDANHGLVRKL